MIALAQSRRDTFDHDLPGNGTNIGDLAKSELYFISMLELGYFVVLQGRLFDIVRRVLIRIRILKLMNA